MFNLKFRKIADILKHFHNTVGKYFHIIHLVRRICSFVLPGSDYGQEAKSFAQEKHGIVRFKTWVKSVRKLISQLLDFVAYQDILAPYISGLTQVGS